MADERKVLAHSAEQIDEAVEKVLDGTVATKTDLQNKADLGEDGKVPAEQVDAYSQSDSISAETRTALSLAETATPDAALAEIARQLSESGGVTMTLLWENASPTSSMQAQTIAIDLGGYDAVFAVCGKSSDYPENEVHLIVKNVVGYRFDFLCISQNGTNYQGLNSWARSLYIAESGITVSTGYYNGSENQKMIIPKRLYGVKCIA